MIRDRSFEGVEGVEGSKSSLSMKSARSIIRCPARYVVKKFVLGYVCNAFYL